MKSLHTILTVTAAIFTFAVLTFAGPALALLVGALAVAALFPAPSAICKVKRLAAPLLMAAVVMAAAHSPSLAALVAFVSLACLADPASFLAGRFGAAPDTNDVASALNLTEILDAAIETFKRAILPLRMFSTVFGNVPLRGAGTIDVPYYPLQGAASKDFSSSYSFSTGAGSKTATRTVTLNKRKYQPLEATSSELARTPLLNLEMLGRMKGERLAYDIIQDVLSVVTAANFGPAVFSGASSGFDSDDVADIRGAINKNATTSVTDGVTTNASTTVTSATAFFTDNDIGITISGTGIQASTTIASVTNSTTAVLSQAATADGTGITFTLGRAPLPWPETGRGLLLNTDYDTALMKDSAVKNAMAAGSDGVIKEGRLPRVLGFDYGYSPAIPGNAENLVGMAVYMSAILFAQAPIPPKDPTGIVNYQIVTDPDTGISIEYREWFDPDSDTLKRVIEANYGYAAGEKLALKRLVSA